jgi:hypothetical protein
MTEFNVGDAVRVTEAADIEGFWDQPFSAVGLVGTIKEFDGYIAVRLGGEVPPNPMHPIGAYLFTDEELEHV